ncbi:helix-turn-helix domain-containing protein, partial [Nitrospinota bacterium]
RTTDVRVFAATNRDLEEEVRSGSFREDLFYRLNVIDLPPLRERGDDVARLAEHFVRKTAAEVGRPAPNLSVETHRLLRDYPWPGNVRELANAIERGVTLCLGDTLEPGDFLERIRNWRTQGTSREMYLRRMEDVEREHILRVVESVGGNKSKAADILGIDRKTLYHKLEKYGVL